MGTTNDNHCNIYLMSLLLTVVIIIWGINCDIRTDFPKSSHIWIFTFMSSFQRSSHRWSVLHRFIDPVKGTSFLRNSCVPICCIYHVLNCTCASFHCAFHDLVNWQFRLIVWMSLFLINQILTNVPFWN